MCNDDVLRTRVASNGAGEVFRQLICSFTAACSGILAVPTKWNEHYVWNTDGKTNVSLEIRSLFKPAGVAWYRVSAKQSVRPGAMDEVRDNNIGGIEGAIVGCGHFLL
jgi:hypothetical protein